MREIALTKGYVTIVDDEDYERLIKHKWYVHKNRYTFYAARHLVIDGKYPLVRMHREIMGLRYNDGQQIDHINRNGLDNRKCNLRIATPTINALNRKMRTDNTSGYRGVSWHKRIGKWFAHVISNKKQIHCGYFSDPISAALAYDIAARKYYGRNAVLNFPEEL